MISLKKIKFGIILIFIPGIFTAFYPGKIVVISFICLIPILFYLSNKILNFKINEEFDNKGVINFYFIFSIITYVRGIFDINSEQDFIVLFSNTTFTLLLYPLFIYLAKFKYSLRVLNALVSIALPLSFVTLFLKPHDMFYDFQHNMSFIYIFVFFIPFIEIKWKLIILLICVFIPFYDLSRRSPLINSAVPLIILFIYYIFPISVFRNLSKIGFFLLITTPVIFLVLGLFGSFNIFNIGESFNEINITKSSNQRNMLVDSRSAIYQDVFSELSRQNSIIYGLGGNGKTRTSLIYDDQGSFDKIYKEGRRATESAMLNQFQYGGIIAAFAYWLLLSVASYNAIFKSNSGIMLMIGLFVAFKVLFSFIEDQLQPNAATFYMMFIIGLCYNNKLRSLKDFHIKTLSKFIFKY